jgi:hypothetical protein
MTVQQTGKTIGTRYWPSYGRSISVAYDVYTHCIIFQSPDDAAKVRSLLPFWRETSYYCLLQTYGKKVLKVEGLSFSTEKIRPDTVEKGAAVQELPRGNLVSRVRGCTHRAYNS